MIVGVSLSQLMDLFFTEEGVKDSKMILLGEIVSYLRLHECLRVLGPRKALDPDETKFLDYLELSRRENDRLISVYITQKQGKGSRPSFMATNGYLCYVVRQTSCFQFLWKVKSF